ncbi:hypothetical protein BGAL_0747g00020 [Botrytis galanthina]|uniref:Uncharacterized protein n=1 Tax=Botrytis galanthina TaxID=278940 RepID=A0A4S8QJQ7_9HELO|nr:hypothetical protein BGAL_0747g00020 [Botrytis galanthina]
MAVTWDHTWVKERNEKRRRIAKARRFMIILGQYHLLNRPAVEKLLSQFVIVIVVVYGYGHDYGDASAGGA